MLDVIKEYLVRLGYDVDVQGFNQAKSSMADLEKAMGAMARTTAGQFAIAGAAVTSFVTVSTLAIGAFISSVAQADYQTEVFARRFFTSEENARAFQASLKALGMDMGDLFYTTNEQYARFLELRREALALEAPAEVQQQLKAVRDLQFQFARLNLTLSQGRYWIAHYFLEFVAGDEQQARKDITEFVDKLQKNLPQIAEKIGAGLAIIARLGMVIYYTVRDVGGAIFSLLDALPGEVKATVAAIGVILFAASGPVGMFIVGITGLLLLLEDFYTYLQGGQSEFAGFWEWLTKLGAALDQSEGMKNTKDAVENLGKAYNNLKTSIQDLLDVLGVDLPEVGSLLKPIDNILKGIADTLNFIASLMLQLSDLPKMGKSLLSGDKQGFIDAFKDFVNRDMLLNALGLTFQEFKGGGAQYLMPRPSIGTTRTWGENAEQGFQAGINQTNTINVYGSSDPHLTAKATVNEIGLLTRNLQGAIR